MDDITKVSELKKEVMDFCNERNWDQFHDPKEIAIAIITEASELLEIFRWKDKQQVQSIMNDPDKLTHVKEEVADVLFLLLRFTGYSDIDLSEALRDKIEKNNVKYPVKEFKGKNHKYDEIVDID